MEAVKLVSIDLAQVTSFLPFPRIAIIDIISGDQFGEKLAVKTELELDAEVRLHYTISQPPRMSNQSTILPTNGEK